MLDAGPGGAFRLTARAARGRQDHRCDHRAEKLSSYEAIVTPARAARWKLATDPGTGPGAEWLVVTQALGRLS